MEIRAENIDGITVLRLSVSTLDASNTQSFKASVMPLLKPAQQVVLDMSALDFVDSSGLGAILSCLRELTGKGGAMKVCGVTKKVRALLELVRFHRILDIYNSVEEAIRACNAR